MKLSTQILIISSLSGVLSSAVHYKEITKRSPPSANGIQFVCDNFPDVCANMCWARDVKDKRRRAAACLDSQKPGNNRCSKGWPGAIQGYNCDEYPFASSKANSAAGATGGKENRCSRCVPSSQNSRQGSVIAKGYKNFCKSTTPCTCNFQVFFANMGKIDHCNPSKSGNCNADAAEQCSGAINIIQKRGGEGTQISGNGYEYSSMEIRDLPTKNMNGTFIPGPAQFRTYSGTLLSAPYGGTIGEAIYKPVAVNETLYTQHIDEHKFDDEPRLDQFDRFMPNMRTDVDYIKEVVWQGALKE